MAEVFIDTSAWYAAVVASHPDHEAVAAALQDVVKAGARLVTTNLVVMETHALLLHRAHRAVALTFARTIAGPPTVVVYSTADLEHRAMADWLARYEDQDFSLADGVSFTVMKARGIRQALALDTHFVTAGFQVIPAAHPARRRR